MPAFTGKRGINARMVGDIEHGRRDTYTLPTLEDIAAAYKVTYMSVMAVAWSGAGELVPAETSGPRALPAPDAGPAGAPGWPRERTEADRPFFDPINERRVELASRGITYPSGAQMFGEATWEAAAWDDPLAHVPVAGRVWGIADMRRRAAARDAGSGVNSRSA